MTSHQNLQSLNLQGNQISSEIYLNLKNCREVNLSNNKIKKLILSAENLNNLQKFSISNNCLEVIEVEGLENLKSGRAFLNLKDVDFSLNRLDNRAVDNFLGNNLSNTNADTDGTCPALTSILLKRNKLKIVPNLSKQDKLIRLNLSENLISELPEINNIYQCKLYNYFPMSLTTLDLDNNKFDTISTDLCYMKNLTRLDLSNNFLARVPPEISFLNKLQYFNINQNPLRAMRAILDKNSEQVLKYLKSRLSEQQLRSLEENSCSMFTELQLRITDSNVIDKEKSSAHGPNTGQLISPKKVSMKAISITNKKLTSISQVKEHYPDVDFSNIKSLNLSKNLITDLKGLEDFSSLCDIDLSQNKLTDDAFSVQSVQPVKLFAATLSEINLNNNQISISTEESFQNFLNSFANINLVSNLLLSSNKINKILPNFYLKFENLITLDLSSNDITQVPPLLGKFKNLKLQRINLDYNGFRVPRANIMSQGSDAILRYLFDRIPV